MNKNINCPTCTSNTITYIFLHKRSNCMCRTANLYVHMKAITLLLQLTPFKSYTRYTGGASQIDSSLAFIFVFHPRWLSQVKLSWETEMQEQSPCGNAGKIYTQEWGLSWRWQFLQGSFPPLFCMREVHYSCSRCSSVT